MSSQVGENLVSWFQNDVNIGFVCSSPPLLSLFEIEYSFVLWTEDMSVSMCWVSWHRWWRKTELLYVTLAIVLIVFVQSIEIHYVSTILSIKSTLFLCYVYRLFLLSHSSAIFAFCVCHSTSIVRLQPFFMCWMVGRSVGWLLSMLKHRFGVAMLVSTFTLSFSFYLFLSFI